MRERILEFLEYNKDKAWSSYEIISALDNKYLNQFNPDSIKSTLQYMKKKGKVKYGMKGWAYFYWVE